MIRLSKLTDYGLVLMSYAARNKGRTVHTARELSLESGLPLPTVSKLLKLLLQAGFLVSHRGINGGCRLAAGTGNKSSVPSITPHAGANAPPAFSTAHFSLLLLHGG